MRESVLKTFVVSWNASDSTVGPNAVIIYFDARTCWNVLTFSVTGSTLNSIRYGKYEIK